MTEHDTEHRLSWLEIALAVVSLAGMIYVGWLLMSPAEIVFDEQPAPAGGMRGPRGAD